MSSLTFGFEGFFGWVGLSGCLVEFFWFAFWGFVCFFEIGGWGWGVYFYIFFTGLFPEVPRSHAGTYVPRALTLARAHTHTQKIRKWNFKQISLCWVSYSLVEKTSTINDFIDSPSMEHNSAHVFYSRCRDITTGESKTWVL